MASGVASETIQQIFFICFIFKMINVDWKFVRGYIQPIFVLKIFIAIKNKKNRGF